MNRKQSNKLDDIGSGVHKLYDLLSTHLPKESIKRGEIMKQFYIIYNTIISTAELQSNEFAFHETERHLKETVEYEEKYSRSSSNISSSSSSSSNRNKMSINEEFEIVLRLSEETARHEEATRYKETQAKREESKSYLESRLEILKIDNGGEHENNNTVPLADKNKFTYNLADKRNYNNGVKSVAATSYSPQYN